MSVRLLLLDLDHTLFDPESIPVGVMEPVFEDLREANRRMRAVPEEVLETSILELMGSPITLVARKYGWPDALRRACFASSATVVLPETLPLYRDVAAIVELPPRKVVVTTGIPAVQRQKFRSLGLHAWIDGLVVDDVMTVPRQGKRAAFAAVLDQEGIAPEHAMVVGDRLDSEIEAGAALRMRTVHVARSGCPGDCPATHCMPDLRGLAGVC